MTLLKIECLKLRRARLWLPLMILPLLSVLYGSINFAGNQEVLKSQWLSLWTQVYLFYGSFFFPCMIGIVCAYVWYSEYKHNTIKLLLTSAYSLRQIIWAKMIVAFGLVMLSQAYFLVLYSLSGFFFHFTMAYPLELIFWALAASLFSLALIAIQSYLSLVVKSFAPPVALSMLLGLGGFILTAQNVVPELGYVLASSKLASLMNQMESVHLALPMTMWLRFIVYSALIVLLSVFLQRKYLKRQLR
ncbi:ABC transporter permease [Streptococcus sp. HF-1907]|uniref:ABC transporter permease n=1 Tax=Streptococcus sp. HF-1907 TaxID=2785793 RepID=UPI0018A0C387|nr:ABC transporter permease [Streptococcus sp. HF-1907]MBF7094600.1 ABC transporter permease [Streptococcus sp. HF-1907]